MRQQDWEGMRETQRGRWASQATYPSGFLVVKPHKVDGWGYLNRTAVVLLCFLERNGLRALYKMTLDLPHPEAKWRPQPVTFLLMLGKCIIFLCV